ncbi:MFS transporter [Nonomuraea diastatica]|uniref:MFS transporter n=1 Tax=Nonomuraea diastatica TaxID=1848329 RepID=UPI0014093814|nr:MFS transporter [Nonomuraea diastatica]
MAGATLMPATLAFIRRLFTDQGQRRVAIGVWTAGSAVGAGLGPLLAGALVQYAWWGAVFLVNVPVMALLLVLAPMVLPEFRARRRRRIDVPGAGLALAATLATIYGAKSIAAGGVAPVPVASIAAGLALGTMLVARQRRHPDPMVDVTLFARPAFGVAVGTGFAGSFALLGAGLFNSQYLQLVAGLPPLHAGLWHCPARRRAWQERSAPPHSRGAYARPSWRAAVSPSPPRAWPSSARSRPGPGPATWPRAAS